MKEFRKMMVLAIFAVTAMLVSMQTMADDDPPTQEQFDDIKKRINKFIGETNRVKRADLDLLEDLIPAICGSDIERDGDKADRAADRIINKAQRKLKPSIDYIQLRQSELQTELKRFLKSGSPFRSNGGRYMGMLRKNGKIIDKLEESVVQGANNPRIRAASVNGQRKHVEMGKKRKYRCSAVEVKAGNGRADCVSFEQCKVWEFKPSTYSSSKAMSQARGYIPYINRKYARTAAAAKCYPDGFEADVASYRACTF